MLLRLDRFEIPAQYMLVFHHVGLFMLSLMLDTERKRRRCWIGKLLTLKATLGLMLLLISTLFLWSVLMLNLAKIKAVLPNSTLTTPWMGLMAPLICSSQFWSSLDKSSKNWTKRSIIQLSKAKDFRQNIDRVKVLQVRNKNWTFCQNSRICSFVQLRIQPAHKGLHIQLEIRWIKVFFFR